MDTKLIALAPGSDNIRAAKALLEQLNADQVLLPGYELNVTWGDTACDAVFGLQQLSLELIRVCGLGSSYVGLVGAACSSATEALATVASQQRLVQVSPLSTAAELSNRTMYPHFFRTIVPDTSIPEIWLRLIRALNARSGIPVTVGTLSDPTLMPVATMQAIVKALNAEVDRGQAHMPKLTLMTLGAPVGEGTSCGSPDDSEDLSRLALQTADVHNIRFITIAAQASVVACTLCSAADMKIAAMYFVFGWYQSNWWATPPSGCGSSTVVSQGQYHIAVNPTLTLSQKSMTCWPQFTPEDIAASFNHTNDLWPVLDAFCVFAVALRQLLIVRPDGPLLAPGLLADSDSLSSELADVMQGISFAGALDGNFQFQPNSSDPLNGMMEIKQAYVRGSRLVYKQVWNITLPMKNDVSLQSLFRRIANVTRLPPLLNLDSVEDIPATSSFPWLMTGLVVGCGSFVLLTALLCLIWRIVFLKHVDLCSQLAIDLVRHIAVVQLQSRNAFVWGLSGGCEDPVLSYKPAGMSSPSMRSGASLQHSVTVLLCVDGLLDVTTDDNFELSAGPCSAVISHAVEELCKKERLDRSCIRCFVLSDSSLGNYFGPLASRLTARTHFLNDELKSESWSSRKLTRFCNSEADLLPILCDMCTYCILIPDEELMENKSKPEPTLAQIRLTNYARLTIRREEWRLPEIYTATMLGGLAASVLKTEGSTFLFTGKHSATGQSNRSLLTVTPNLHHQTRSNVPYSSQALKHRRSAPALVPLTQQEAKIWDLSKWMYSAEAPERKIEGLEGCDLSGFMLNLWCLALSHGSEAFATNAYEWLTCIDELVEMDRITRRLHCIWASVCQCCPLNWDPPHVAMAAIVRALFISSLSQTPITPPGDKLPTKVDLREMRRQRRLGHLSKEQLRKFLQALDYRRLLCNFKRIAMSSLDRAENFRLLPEDASAGQASLILPMQHPSARLLQRALQQFRQLLKYTGFLEEVDPEAVEHEDLQAVAPTLGRNFTGRVSHPGVIRETAEDRGAHDDRDTEKATPFPSPNVTRQTSLSVLHMFPSDVPAQVPGDEGNELCHDFFNVVRRIQLYIVTYLRKINSGEEAILAKSSAREHYVSVVEGYSELVGPVRAHLVDKAESRAYQELVKEASKDLSTFATASPSGPLMCGPSVPASPGSTMSMSVSRIWRAASGVASVASGKSRDSGAQVPWCRTGSLITGHELKRFLSAVGSAQRRLEVLVDSIARELDTATEQCLVYVDPVIWAPKDPWRIVQETTLRQCADGIRVRVGLELKDMAGPEDREKFNQAIDDALVAVASDISQNGFSLIHVKCPVRTSIVCKDFRLMLAMLKKLRHDDGLVVQAVKNRWGPARWRFPHVLVRAMLIGTASGGHVDVEIRLTHEKIAAVWRGEYGIEPRYNVAALRSVFKTLHLGDLENHPSMWCISLQQLKQFGQKALAKLGREAYEKASTSDIVREVVQPETEAAGRSYACMVNWRELRPVDVFISHAWQENFSSFVASVAKALENRVRAQEVSLWICSFALFQSDDTDSIKDQIGSDLTKAPFEKALQRAKEFLVVRNLEVDLYSRAWCAYEVFRATQLGIKISVTGPESFTGGAVDIMSCTATDKEDERRIKDAIRNAGEIEALNKIVTEIKAIKKPA